jgi:hypothetical protein
MTDEDILAIYDERYAISHFDGLMPHVLAKETARKEK